MTNTDIKETYTLAERLRIKIAETASPTGKPITISLGISTYREEDRLPQEVIEKADTAPHSINQNMKVETEQPSTNPHDKR